MGSSPSVFNFGSFYFNIRGFFQKLLWVVIQHSNESECGFDLFYKWIHDSIWLFV